MSLTISVQEIINKSNNPLLGIHKSWGRVQLGLIAHILNGFAFSSSKFSKSGEGMPLIRIRDIGYNRTDCTYTGSYDSKYIVKPGDLLIGMDGDFKCARWSGPEALLNQRVCKVDIRSSYYNPKLLDFVLPVYSNAINSYTSSVTVKHLSSNTIMEIPLPLPPLSEQHRIVDKIEELFSKLDAGIESLKKVQAQVKRYRQAVLKHAFEGKLTAAWREANKPRLEPALVLLNKAEIEKKKNISGKKKENSNLDIANLTKLPEGWEWTRFENVIDDFKRGPFGSSIKKEYFVPTGYKVYEQQNAIYKTFKRGNYYISEEKFNELKAFEVKPLDYIVSCSGTIGCLYRLPKDAPIGVINQALLRIRINENIIAPLYFNYLFESHDFQQRIIKDAKGTAIKNIAGVKELRAVPFPLCSKDEQLKIVEEIERRFSIADRIEEIVEQNLKRAERLRQSILKKAFEGKLVSQDPTDEPASVLLERIKAEKEKADKKDQCRRSKN